MTPAVSVAIAAYNYDRYLSGALESALRQTLRDIEVVVVDDGSTDRTPAVVRPFLLDPRVRYVRTEHRGVSVAKNLAVRTGTAPLVAFLDADDVWLPQKLERQLPLLERDPGVGVAYTRRYEIDPEGRRRPFRRPPFHRGRVAEPLFRGNFICFSSAVIRRDAFERAGGFDESLPMAVDYDLWLRVALTHRFDYVEEPLVLYRRGHANISSRHEERILVALGVMRRFLERSGGMVPPATVRRAFAETYFNLSLARRRRSRLAALPANVRAITLAPGFLPAWKALVSLPLPNWARRALRRLAGRPVGWDDIPAELKQDVEALARGGTELAKGVESTATSHAGTAGAADEVTQLSLARLRDR